MYNVYILGTFKRLPEQKFRVIDVCVSVGPKFVRYVCADLFLCIRKNCQLITSQVTVMLEFLEGFHLNLYLTRI